MEECMNQKYVTEFPHAEKMAPTDIHQCLLNIYGDQTADVSTVRQWIMHFSSSDSNSGSPPLMRIFRSVACRLLLNTEENV